MKRTDLTPEKFRCVKILVESGATYEEITSMTGVSHMTITRIKRVQTFEEYKHELRVAAVAYAAKKKQKAEQDFLIEAEVKKQEQLKAQEQEEINRGEQRKQEKQIPVVMQNSYQMNRLIELVKEQNEILRVMSNKVAFIVDELTK